MLHHFYQGEIHKQLFITDPLFVFHHINAYETKENSEIHVDFCGYDVDKFDINSLNCKDIFTEKYFTKCAVGLPRRIIIPISAPYSSEPIRCELRKINPTIAFELPTINYERFNGKEYKYAYGVNLFKQPFSIVKVT